MAHTESSSRALLAHRARALRVGVFGPVGDLIARVGQAVGIPVGANLTQADQAAINTFYAARKWVEAVTPDVTTVVSKFHMPLKAGNDDNFHQNSQTNGLKEAA